MWDYILQKYPKGINDEYWCSAYLSSNVSWDTIKNNPNGFGFQQFEESGIEPAETQNHSDSFCSRLMGRNITEVPEEVQKSNPETYITPDDPPFYIQHGTADNLVPYQQSAELAEKLKAVIGESKVTYVEMPGEGHCSTGFTNFASVSRVLDFLDATLK